MKNKTNTNENTSKGINKKVVINSVIALVCLALMYLIHWLFIIPAIYLVYKNQKELMNKK